MTGRRRCGAGLAAVALLGATGCSGSPQCPLRSAEVRTPPGARWDPKLQELVSFDHGEAWLSPYFVYGTNLLLPLLVMAALGVRLLLLGRKLTVAVRSERAAQATEPRPGETVLHGQVKLVEDGGPPVRLTIEQSGTSKMTHKSNGVPRYCTTWTEVDRRLEVRPFLLQTAAGEVRVEPDSGVFLVDDLTQSPPSGARRTCVAEIVEGEHVYALGTLELGAASGAGYRGGKGWVLRPPADGHMLLSSGSLRRRYLDRWSATFALIVLFVVLTLGAQLMAWNYHRAFASGRDEAGIIVSRCDYRGKKERYCYVRYRVLSTGQELDERVSCDDYPRLQAGTVVPVNVLGRGPEPRVTLGAGATTYAANSLVPLLAILIATGATPFVLRRSKPWYERDRVIDQVDGKLDQEAG